MCPMQMGSSDADGIFRVRSDRRDQFRSDLRTDERHDILSEGGHRVIREESIKVWKLCSKVGIEDRLGTLHDRVWIEADVDSRDLLEVFDSHDGVNLRL